MTGPPSTKHEPTPANHLCILETSSTESLHNSSCSRLLTVSSPDTVLFETLETISPVDTHYSNQALHCDIKTAPNLKSGKFAASEACDKGKEEVKDRSRNNYNQNDAKQEEPSGHNHPCKIENRTSAGVVDKTPNKKRRRYSAVPKKQNGNNAVPTRRPSFPRRTSRLYSFQLPAVTKRNNNSKVRGSFSNASSSPYATPLGSKSGGTIHGSQSSLVVAPGRTRSGCVVRNNGGKGRNCSHGNAEAKSSSMSSLLLLPTPASTSPLSSTVSSFNSSPQSTSLLLASCSSQSSSTHPSSTAATVPTSSFSSTLLSLPTFNSNKNRDFSFIIRGRGLARAVDDTHPPIETIVDDDLLNRTYVANIQKAYESQFNTPCSSGHTSPTIKESQSPLSVSHGGWTTGNTTERSSLDSSYSLDDFDKQAATTVGQHFAEIESLLFEGHSSTKESSTSPPTPPHADVHRECQEWVTQFPHLRVLGKQACPSKDTGFYHVPSRPHVLNPLSTASRPSSSLLIDVTENELNITSSTETHSLSLVGQSMSIHRIPIHSAFSEGDRGGLLPLSSSSSSTSSSSSSLITSLAEEVIEEDGVYEDIIAVDYKDIYEENMENKKQITPRRRREGFPPITPNACVKDSVTSGAFDHIWQEIMSWMRELLMKYTAEITDTKLEVISFSPTHHHVHQTIPTSRELSFIQSRPFPMMQRSHTTHGVDSSTDRSIDGILHISSMPLQTRNQPGDVTESQVLVSNRPGSSFNPQHPSRPMSTIRSQRGARGGRLAPLGDRSKTPNMEEERPTRAVAMDALRVRRLPTISDPLPAPNFHRNGALPPLEMERPPPRKLLQGNRASSAIDKDMRFLSIKERAHFFGEQARPNTTHAMRSETPFGGVQNRRSSTPLGNSITTRNSLLAKQALDVRGNSLQVVGGMESTAHFHPDILEDTQEGPVDEVIRTHWNPPAQVSHSNPYRRGKTSIR